MSNLTNFVPAGATATVLPNSKKNIVLTPDAMKKIAGGNKDGIIIDDIIIAKR